MHHTHRYIQDVQSLTIQFGTTLPFVVTELNAKMHYNARVISLPPFENMKGAEHEQWRYINSIENLGFYE